jgi:hypothetical protein
MSLLAPIMGGHRNARLVQQPGQGNLGRADAAGFGQFDHPLQNGKVGFFVIHLVGELVAFGPFGWPFAPRLPVAGQKAARQRTPGNDAHPLIQAEGEHFPLLFAVDQVHVVLHGDEAGPAVEIGRILGFGELPGVHAAGPDVERLARLDHVVQRFHRLFDGHAVVPAVNLVEIDVIGAQAAQRVVDGFHDVLARQAAAVGAAPDGEVDFGGQDHFFTRGCFPEQLARHFFADAEGVHIGRIEEVDPQFNGALE